MTTIVAKRESGRALRSRRRTPTACAERPASVPREIPPLFLIQHLRHKAALNNAVLLTQVGDVWVACDEDAAVVARTISGELCYRECAGESLAVCVVAMGDVDSTIELLRDGGHNVAVAAQLENPDAESGVGGTVVIRNLRAKSWSDGASAPIAQDEGLRAEMESLLRMFSSVPPAARALLRRALWNYTDRLTTFAARHPDPDKWPEEWDEPPSEFCIAALQEIAGEVAALDEETQTRVVKMIRRFRERLPETERGQIPVDNCECMEAPVPLRLVSCMEADRDAHRP